MKNFSSNVESGASLGKRDYGNYFGSAKNKIETGCCMLSGNRIRKK